MRETATVAVATLIAGSLVLSALLAGPRRASLAALAVGGPAEADCHLQLALDSRGADDSARAVPVSDGAGLAVGWQDGEAIYVRRFDRSCSGVGDRIEVNRSRSFFERPEDSGIGDVAGVGHSSAIVVAWALDGDVWLRIVDTSAQLGPIQRVSNATGPTRSRAEVKVHPLAAGEAGLTLPGFIVVWSSWGQDGDGWGMFARLYTAGGMALSTETQLNVFYRDFQWHPQLVTCGGALWALWANTSESGCPTGPGSDGGSGPALRHLSAPGSNASGLAMGAENPTTHIPNTLTSVLTCNGDTSPESGVVQLLRNNDGRLQVDWQIFSSTSPSIRRSAAEPSSDHGTAMMAPGDALLADPADDIITSQWSARSRRLQGAQGPGDLNLLACPGFLLLLATDSSGLLAGQLLEFSIQKKTLMSHRKRDILKGGRHVQAAWDLGGSSGAALLLCLTSTDVGDVPTITCARRGLSWLAGGDDLDFGSALTFIAWCGLIVSFCCFRSCARAAGVRGALRQPVQRAAALARLRDLREQLEQIPSEPPGAARDPGDEEDEEEVAARQPVAGTGEVCAICQNDVVVRVAFRPCGHTACRDCVGRVVEINQRCHICRAVIEGVQPVYL